MIECQLRELGEFQYVLSRETNKKKRKGYYSHSVLPIKGVGRDKWPVVVKIDVDYEKYIEEGMTENEIISQCVDFLNQAPPRKKYAKKKPKPLYGHLEIYKAYLKEDEDGKYIEAELTTDQRKNKNFWREGLKYGKVKMPSKLRRK